MDERKSSGIKWQCDHDDPCERLTVLGEKLCYDIHFDIVPVLVLCIVC